MRLHSNILFGLIAAMLFLVGALLPNHSWAAVDCSGSTIGTIDFGSVNPLTMTDKSISGTLAVNCTSNDASLLGLFSVSSDAVALDFSIDNGSAGSTGSTRLLSSGSNNMPAQLYQDPAHTKIWGGTGSDWPGNPFQPTPFNFTASYSTTFPIYARLVVPASVKAGSYQASFNASVEGKYSRCTLAALSLCVVRTPTTIPKKTFDSFIVKAQVIDACRIDSATDMDFGSVSGLLGTPHTATSTIQVTCTNGTSYNIGLDNGSHYGSGSRRMTDGSGHYVNYTLYQDPGHNQKWTSTNTVPGTGNGTASHDGFTVYGVVPAQGAKTSGTYSDTVQVKITY